MRTVWKVVTITDGRTDLEPLLLTSSPISFAISHQRRRGALIQKHEYVSAATRPVILQQYFLTYILFPLLPSRVAPPLSFHPHSLSSMRFSAASLLAILAVTSSSLAAAVTRTTSSPQSINPDTSVLQNVAARNLHARAPAPAPMTNAQRMARGLPPKAPTRRNNQPSRPKPSSTPPYVPVLPCVLQSTDVMLQEEHHRLHQRVLPQ